MGTIFITCFFSRKLCGQLSPSLHQCLLQIGSKTGFSHIPLETDMSCHIIYSTMNLIPENVIKLVKGLLCNTFCTFFIKLYITLMSDRLYVLYFQKPYVCSKEGCGKCYKRVDHLNRHMQTAHQDEDTDKIRLIICQVFYCSSCKDILCHLWYYM